MTSQTFRRMRIGEVSAAVSRCTGRMLFERPSERAPSVRLGSSRWMEKRLKDRYVREARQLGYRARSAFKLVEIDRKYGMLSQGMVAVDCGAAPGAWSQVLVERVGSSDERCTVLSVDKLDIDPLSGAHVLSRHDVTLPSTRASILDWLASVRPRSLKADILVSDMAPSRTANKSHDHDTSLGLCYVALDLAGACLTTQGKGSFLCKLWDGASTNRLEGDLGKLFSRVDRVKPKASRPESAELYFLARGFKGLQ